MVRLVSGALLGASIFLSGCATIFGDPPGEELAGRTLRVQTSRGQVSNMLFNRDGTVAAFFGRNQAQGRWQVDKRRLCFMWTGAPRECWPYAARFQRRVPVEIVSDRGNRVRVTMQ